jgi:hypothetical protein
MDRASATLRMLDLSDIAVPIAEVSRYLVAKYEDRFRLHPKLYEDLVGSAGQESSCLNTCGQVKDNIVLECSSLAAFHLTAGGGERVGATSSRRPHESGFTVGTNSGRGFLKRQ